MADDTYPTPDHGWTCFHCGETFPGDRMGERAAKEHFGDHIAATPACQLWAGATSWRSAYRKLIRHIRQIEGEVNQLRHEACEEDSAKDRQMHAMRSAHAAALQREEEKGYARGLADGREEALLAGDFRHQ